MKSISRSRRKQAGLFTAEVWQRGACSGLAPKGYTRSVRRFTLRAETKGGPKWFEVGTFAIPS